MSQCVTTTLFSKHFVDVFHTRFERSILGPVLSREFYFRGWRVSRPSSPSPVACASYLQVTLNVHAVTGSLQVTFFFDFLYIATSQQLLENLH